jgi:hypothetical protein
MASTEHEPSRKEPPRVPTLRNSQIQFFQVGTGLFLSPLVTGVVAPS